MKKSKGRRTGEVNTSHSQTGMGDYYGVGIKNPMGKSRDVMGFSPIKSKSLKKPPKSLA
jgi:hypothetical protein